MFFLKPSFPEDSSFPRKRKPRKLRVLNIITSHNKNFLNILLLIASISLYFESTAAETYDFKNITTVRAKNAIIYNLTIDYKTVNFTGKNRKAMVVNDSLPAPTLHFEEGKKAIIYVTNKMDVETSVHWHGILLPNFQDGVPYLTSPPIRPGKTHKFEFTLKQSGTYWYHSHTGLQEQRGIYGAIVVEPKKKKYKYNHDLVLVLSDWTNENPKEVLRTLKRGSEWYAIKKGSALSLSQVIGGKALRAQLTMWKQKMPGMDISDVYYDTFLINGQKERHYTDFKAGEKVRLRIINASASTYFWLSFGGKAPLLIAADGLYVKPVPVKKILHAIAETYDLFITLPKNKAIEIRAMAQDGSGVATAIIGKGELLKAPVIPRPDPIQEMKAMAKMHSGGHAGHDMHKGHHNHSMHKKHNKPHHDKIKQPDLNKHKHHKHHNHRSIQSKKTKKLNKHKHYMHTEHIKHKAQPERNTKHNKYKTLHYNDLKSLQKTSFPKTNKLKEMHFNLTGNMWRYVWSMNGTTLSRADKIKIKKGETVRIHMHNTTMMHHPMHLHGHFFRVLNKQGDHSPLKHTVDVPPMNTVTIEFDPDEEGDWIFHCHVLYHMESGMSRVFSLGENRDPRLLNYPISKILNMDNHWYKWGEVNLMSNRFDWELIISNTKNKVMLEGTFSWVDDYYNLQDEFEMELSYEYFINDFFRIYSALELEQPLERGHTTEVTYPLFNKSSGVLEYIRGKKDTATKKYPLINYYNQMDVNARIGIRYLLPYFFELDINVDNQARGQIGLEYELLLFQRTEFFAEWEWTMDFGIINELYNNITWIQEHEWSVGLNYILTKNFSLTASYSNHFSWGAGLNWKF